jgi:hypothetical protein
MRFFIAGGGCYGSFYVRQLDRARALGKLVVDEIVVVDRNPECAVAASLPQIEGAQLVVLDWLDFGRWLWERRADLRDAMWVPTPLGPHILYHWVKRGLEDETGHTFTPLPFTGALPVLPYAQTTPTGTLVLSHAPGLCPVHCIEPKTCPLTEDLRDWEMKDTVRRLIEAGRKQHGIEDVAVFVCQHHAHGVGTIPLRQIYAEWERLRELVQSRPRARLAVATVSSCHGILDAFESPAC